jgi:uncharacterized C2H2 Zn-finger protein
MKEAQVLLRSLRTLTSKRRSLKTMEHRLDAEERKLMGQIGRRLLRSGYQLVPATGKGGAGSARRPRRRLARQNLKCPKCDRRFSFEMHLARHVNAMHSTGAARRDARKTARRKARRAAEAAR